MIGYTTKVVIRVYKSSFGHYFILRSNE